MTPTKNETEHRKLTIFTLRMGGDLIATFAVPVAVLVWIARRIDAVHPAPKPVFTIAAFLASFFLSTAIVSLKAAKYGAEYERLTSNEGERGPPGQPDTYG